MKTDFLHFLDIAILPPKEDWNNNIQEEYPEIAQDIQIINEYFKLYMILLIVENC